MPLSVIVAWTMGIAMDLDFKLLETGSLLVAVLATTFTLQVREPNSSKLRYIHTYIHTLTTMRPRLNSLSLIKIADARSSVFLIGQV